MSCPVGSSFIPESISAVPEKAAKKRVHVGKSPIPTTSWFNRQRRSRDRRSELIIQNLSRLDGFDSLWCSFGPHGQPRIKRPDSVLLIRFPYKPDVSLQIPRGRSRVAPSVVAAVTRAVPTSISSEDKVALKLHRFCGQLWGWMITPSSSPHEQWVIDARAECGRRDRTNSTFELKKCPRNPPGTPLQLIAKPRRAHVERWTASNRESRAADRHGSAPIFMRIPRSRPVIPT